MYTLTITVNSAEDLLRLAQKLAPQTMAIIEPTKSKKEKKEETKENTPLVSTTSVSTGEVGVASDVTYDNVKNAVLEVAKLKGRDASLDFLAHFGVVDGSGKDRKGNISNLKPEQYADVIAKAKEMLS